MQNIKNGEYSKCYFYFVYKLTNIFPPLNILPCLDVWLKWFSNKTFYTFLKTTVAFYYFFHNPLNSYTWHLPYWNCTMANQNHNWIFRDLVLLVVSGSMIWIRTDLHLQSLWRPFDIFLLKQSSKSWYNYLKLGESRLPDVILKILYFKIPHTWPVAIRAMALWKKIKTLNHPSLWSVPRRLLSFFPSVDFGVNDSIWGILNWFSYGGLWYCKLYHLFSVFHYKRTSMTCPSIVL